LPPDVRRAVADAARPVLAEADVRPVAEENLHVTIRFLGDVAPERLPAVRRALAEAAASVAEGEARVAFEERRWKLSPQIWCAHVDESPANALSALEREVTPRIAPLGFPPETRPFLPHITVGRIRRGGRRPRPRREGTDALRDAASPAQAPVGPSFPVRELTLFDSELTPRGPRYTALDRFPLQPISPKERP
jgi:2'-5' RNA ligase